MTAPLALSAVGFAAAVAAGGLGTYAALSPGSQLFGRTLIAGSDPNEVALTFDDGPNGDTTMRLLDVLARHEAKATFFVIGRFVREQPEIVRAIHAAGHLVGNHTMTHPWLHIQSHRRIREELLGCNQAIEDVLGEPVRYFRAPHGARRPYVLRYAGELGLTAVQWNIIAFDWNPHPSADLIRLVEHGIARNLGRRRSSNILMHDGGDTGLGADRIPTVEAVDEFLTSFRAKGMRTVRVDAWQ
jgi:peptidoglycan/xylan/chitin deacetylase (PgdA/CDA1 family)